jgi:hypothetical protein
MKFMEELLQFPESRTGQRIEYRIGSMIAIVLVGFMAGRDSLKGCHRYVTENLGKWQVKRIGIRSGKLPTYAALCNAFHESDVAKLAEFFGSQVLKDRKSDKELHIKIDGKSLTGSKLVAGANDDGSRAVHILHAYSSELGGVIGSVQVDSKTNEAKAILDLLDNFDLENLIISGDAMFCQKEIVKKNQGKGRRLPDRSERKSKSAASKNG